MESYDATTNHHDRSRIFNSKNRSCTDIPCLIIFVVIIGGWLTVGIYSVAYGDVNSKLASNNSDGEKCGIDPEVSDKPYLLFFDLMKCANNYCDTRQVCQAECPSTNWYFDPSKPLDEIREKMICTPSVKVENKSLSELTRLVNKGLCASWYLASEPIVRICFPKTIPSEFPNAIIIREKLLEARFIFDKFSRTQRIWDKTLAVRGTVILIASSAAAICLIFITLLRWFALPCITSALIGICTLLLSLACVSSNYYIEGDSAIWILVSIALVIVTGYLFIQTFIHYHRVILAAEFLEEVSKAVIATCSVFPIFSILVHLLITVWSMTVGVGLSSIDNRIDVERPSFIVCLYLIHIIGEIWLRKFVFAVEELILARIFLKWYWTFHELPVCNSMISISRIFRYHLGTAALGSILTVLIAQFKIFLVILRIISRRIKCCAHSISNHMTLVNASLRFVDRHAYIMCASNGKNLQTSSTHASELIHRNTMQVLTLNKFVEKVLMAGKVFITGSMAGFTWWQYSASDDEYIWILVLFATIGTLMMTEIFFNITGTAADTIFLCFLEDREKNDGSKEKPYYMTSKLANLFIRKEIYS